MCLAYVIHKIVNKQVINDHKNNITKLNDSRCHMVQEYFDKIIKK